MTVFSSWQISGISSGNVCTFDLISSQRLSVLSAIILIRCNSRCNYMLCWLEWSRNTLVLHLITLVIFCDQRFTDFHDFVGFLLHINISYHLTPSLLRRSFWGVYLSTTLPIIIPPPPTPTPHKSKILVPNLVYLFWCFYSCCCFRHRCCFCCLLFSRKTTTAPLFWFIAMNIQWVLL